MSFIRPGSAPSPSQPQARLLTWVPWIGGFFVDYQLNVSGFQSWGYNTAGSLSLGGSGNLETRWFRCRRGDRWTMIYADYYFLSYSAIEPSSLIWLNDMVNHRPTSNQTIYLPLTNGQTMRHDIRASDGQVTLYRPSGSSTTPVVGRAAFQWRSP